MKKIITFIILVSVTTLGFSQEKTTKETPEGSWTVNKQYDEEGNLISKDSTYSYHSYNGKAITKAEADSIYQQLKKEIPSDFASSAFFKDFKSEDIQDILDEIDFQSVENFLNNEELGGFFEEFDYGGLNDLIENFDINSFDHSFIKEFIDTQDKDMQDLIQKYMKDFELNFNDQKSDENKIKAEKEHSESEENLMKSESAQHV